MSDKITPKGSRHYDLFNNYVDKKRGEGVSRKSTPDQVTEGRYHNNVHSKGGKGSKLGKIWST